MVPPNIIRQPSVVISGSRHNGLCDDLVLSVGSSTGNIGKSLFYQWSAYSYTQSNDFLWESVEGSTYSLSPNAWNAFNNAETLRIELYTENWVRSIYNSSISISAKTKYRFQLC